MKKRSYRGQKVNEYRWEEVADRVKVKGAHDIGSHGSLHFPSGLY